jgi:hypothetical protein
MQLKPEWLMQKWLQIALLVRVQKELYSSLIKWEYILAFSK